MGCSHGKTASPVSTHVSTSAAKPRNATSALSSPRFHTLLNATSAQKYAAPDKCALQSLPIERTWTTSQSAFKELLEELDTNKDGYVDAKELAASRRQDSTMAGQLRSKALRVFVMVDKLADGRLDLMTLASEGEEAAAVETLQGLLEIRSDASFSQTEWLEVIGKAADRSQNLTALFLDWCLGHLAEQKEHWPLRQQALNVFRLGDKNNDGQLDMDEMAELRQSADFAQALMGEIDLDKNGTVSKGEWLAYIKRLADVNQESAAAVLEMYKEQLTRAAPADARFLTNAMVATESPMAKSILEDPMQGNAPMLGDPKPKAKPIFEDPKPMAKPIQGNVVRSFTDTLLEDSSANANQRYWACC